MNATGGEHPSFAGECRSAEELRVWLEDYNSLVDAQPVPGRGGDLVGDIHEPDRLYRLMVQNAVIDAGMKQLLREDVVRWRVLNQFYRQGMWAERKGWVTPARSAGLAVPVCLNFMRCTVGDDRMERTTCTHGRGCPEHHEHFEELLAAAIEALFALIKDAQGGQNTLGVDKG